VAELHGFVQQFPYRQSGQAMHEGARDWLADRLEGAGLEVLRHRFPAGTAGLPLYEGENIVGVKWGSDRRHWVVVGAHYDTTEGSVQGAYDDGGGTLMVVALAEAFASASTDRTIAFALFDQEDRGFLGTHAFVRDALQGRLGDVVLDAAVDLDMVGITWPHPAPLGCWVNSPTMKGWVETLRAQAGMPAEKVEYRVPNGGTTHAAAFVEAGIAQASFWSNMDQAVMADGTTLPGANPWWHSGDTWETMLLMAGDEATLRAGFQTVLDIASGLAWRAADRGFTPDPA
jgi:Zn-dependent M28 family amino/carboxypeptidase